MFSRTVVLIMCLNPKNLLYSLLVLFCLASCAKHGSYLYETTRIALSNADNGGTKAIDSLSSVHSKAYAAKLKIHNVITGHTGPAENKSEDSYSRRYSLSYLKLTTLQPFDIAHPAGADISDYFLYYYSSKYTLDYLVEAHVMNSPRISGMGQPDTEFDESYYFMLMHQPDSSGAYTFRIELKFSDGSSFTDTTHVTLINEL